MVLQEITRVKFNEEEHTYLLDDKVYLKGVTTIMKENGLSPDYGNIDPEVLAHAAKMGTLAHKTIEDYCAGLPVVQNSLIKTFKALNLDVVCTEYLVSDMLNVASSIDMVVKADENSVDLIDMKRTSEVHMEALAWQLGIYKYLFKLLNPDINVNKCYCLHIKKGLKDSIDNDKCQPLIEVKPISEEIVEDLFLCIHMGLEFNKHDYLPSNKDVMKVEEWKELEIQESKLMEAELIVKQLTPIVKEMRNKIITHMINNNIESLETKFGKYSLKRAYTKQSFDSTLFKSEHSDMYNKYLKTTEVAPSITFKSI